MQTPDVEVSNQGSLILVRPLTDAADEWIGQRVQEDATWWYGSLVVEHRYADALIEGMRADGLVVE